MCVEVAQDNREPLPLSSFLPPATTYLFGDRNIHSRIVLASLLGVVWYRPLALSELLRCWFVVRHLEFVVVALSVLSEVQFDIAICVRRLVLPNPKLLSLASLALASVAVRASEVIRLGGGQWQLDIKLDIASPQNSPTHNTSTTMSVQPLITFKAGQCEFIVSASLPAWVALINIY